jgi:hypothetical protein
MEFLMDLVRRLQDGPLHTTRFSVLATHGVTFFVLYYGHFMKSIRFPEYEYESYEPCEPNGTQRSTYPDALMFPLYLASQLTEHLFHFTEFFTSGALPCVAFHPIYYHLHSQLSASDLVTVMYHPMKTAENLYLAPKQWLADHSIDFEVFPTIINAWMDQILSTWLRMYVRISTDFVPNQTPSTWLLNQMDAACVRAEEGCRHLFGFMTESKQCSVLQRMNRLRSYFEQFVTLYYTTLLIINRAEAERAVQMAILVHAVKLSAIPSVTVAPQSKP